jgi:hypothetical protein
MPDYGASTPIHRIMKIKGNHCEEWNQAWCRQPHRYLNLPLKIELMHEFGIDGSPFGNIVSATISETPSEYIDYVFRYCDECPICGETTLNVPRLAAQIHPKFENGSDSILLAVWVHPYCFESCPKTEKSAPIPW